MHSQYIRGHFVVAVGVFCWLSASIVSAQNATDLTCSNCVGPGEVAPNAIAYGSLNGQARQFLANQANDVAQQASDLNALTATVTALQTQVDAIQQVPNSPAIFEYVGFSTGTVAPNVGFGGMAAACQADYGANSRMATTVEVISGTSFPVSVSLSAWVQPVIVSVTDTNNANTSEFLVADASGVIVQATGIGDFAINCNGWSNNTAGSTALRVNSAAAGHDIRVGTCASVRAVACSVRQ